MDQVNEIPIEINWLYKKIILDFLILSFIYLLLSLLLPSSMLLLIPMLIILSLYLFYTIKLFKNLKSYKTFITEKHLSIPYSFIFNERLVVNYGDISSVQIKKGIFDSLFNTKTIQINFKSRPLKLLMYGFAGQGIGLFFQPSQGLGYISIVGVNASNVNEVVDVIEVNRKHSTDTGVELHSENEVLTNFSFNRTFILLVMVAIIALFIIYFFMYREYLTLLLNF